VQPALVFAQAADPAGPAVVPAVPAKKYVHLVDKQQRKFPESLIVSPAVESQEVAHGKSICPKVAALDLAGRPEPGPGGKFNHHF
jgi:hypothetical protein